MSRGRKIERGSSGSQKNRSSKSRSKKNIKCYNCGKKGHFKHECWLKKGAESTSESSKNHGNIADVDTSDDGATLFSEAITTSKEKRKLTDVWLLDSGASWHMTSNRNWFHTYEPISEGVVYMGNNHPLEIVGIGSIKLKSYDGATRTIQGVRHVKGLKKNLLSLGQFDEIGCKIRVEGGTMKIVRSALVVLKARKIAPNLFMLMGETYLEAQASIALVGTVEEMMMMWHKRLGHMSEKGLKVLSDRKLLPGLTKVSLPLCEHCVVSKQHRLKFNTSTARSKNILDLVHSDVWQAPVPSLGGANYFVSFIDDFSRRSWVYPIKRKSDVFSVFKRFKA